MNDETLERLDERVQALERRVLEENAPFSEALQEALELTDALLRHYARVAKEQTLPEGELLEVLRAFLKGDPSLNAVRDNVRELIYYRNCLAQGREDALPAQAARMAVRTVAHIHLYLRVRLEQMDLAEG